MSARQADSRGSGSPGESPSIQRTPSQLNTGTLTAGPSVNVEFFPRPICLASCLVVCIVCLFIYFIKTRQTSVAPASFIACDGPACAEPQAALESLLDHEVRPCDDFYAHVCGSWIKSRQRDSFLEESVARYMEKTRDVIASTPHTAVSEKLGEAVDTAKRLLSECLTHMANGQLDLTQEVQLFFRKLRLNHVVNATSSLEAMAAGSEVSFRFNLNGLVRLRPHKAKSTAVLYALRGIPLLIAFPIKAVLEHYVRKIVAATSATQSSTRELASKIVSLDSRIATFYRRKEAPFQKIESGKIHLEPPELVAVATGPLDTFARRSNFKSVLLLVRNYNSTVSALQFFPNAAPGFLPWYIVVQILTDLLQFDYVKRFRGSEQTVALPTCVASMNSALSPVWSVISRRLLIGTLDNATFDPIYELLQGVKKAIRSGKTYLMKLKKDPTLSKLRESLDAIEFVSGQQLATHENNIEFRSSLFGTSFLLDHISVRAQARRQMQFNPPDYTWDVNSAIEFKTRAFYLHEYGSLFVPIALLTHDVFYRENASRFFNYGTLGAIVAREMLKALTPGSTQLGENLWTPEATRLYMSHMNCYVTFQGYRAGIWTFNNKRSDEFQRELLLWLMSARVAYAALKDDFATVSHSNVYWKTVQRHFFLRFCLAACGSSSKTALSSRQKCLWPMFDMPEFVDAFECPPRSYMASQRRCRE